MRNIKDEILKNLKEIEHKENVTILHCVESGSRAWGFESPDSDYDVRFIYIHKFDYYLNLEKQRDVIEWKLDDVLDINGWDIQKMLRLLYKSNPTVFEWNASPIIYKTTNEWDLVKNVIPNYFNEKSGLYHYLSMAKTNYRTYLREDKVRLKKYFYVLRPLLACRWIIDKHLPPPMLFSELVDSELDKNIKPYIDDLLEIKKTTSELGIGNRINSVNEFIEFQLNEIQSIVDQLSIDKKMDWKSLDSLFKNLLRIHL